MSMSEIAGCCGACGFLAAWICWLVYGGLALNDSVEHAKSCGWMLWGSTLAELIYVPFGVLFSLVASAGSVMALCSDKEDISTGSGFLDGCFGACIIVCLNIINGIFIGVGAVAIWKEDCIPHDLAIVTFAQVSFYMCAVSTGLSLLTSGMAAVKHVCCSSA